MHSDRMRTDAISESMIRANVAGRIGNGFSPAESSFLCPNPMMMMIWDYKREGNELFRHLQGS